jgi:hypothetical protein
MGHDIGRTINAMFVMHWFGLVTLPVAALIAAAWVLTEVLGWALRRQET